MAASMTNPAVGIPGTVSALEAFGNAADQGSLPETLAEFVHLRASQINGCTECVALHTRDLKEAGESDERIWAIAAWRDAPYFTDAERAALALTEALTRLSDRAAPVSDQIFDEAARHFEKSALDALVLHVTLINTWNRLSVTTEQVAGR
jgi:AhpD family alkylhydroperoxidase